MMTTPNSEDAYAKATGISGLRMLGLEHINFLSLPQTEKAVHVHKQVLATLDIPELQAAPVFVRLSKSESEEPYALIQLYHGEEVRYTLTTNIRDGRIGLLFSPPANRIISALSLSVAYGPKSSQLGWDFITVILGFNPESDKGHFWERRGDRSGVVRTGDNGRGQKMVPLEAFENDAIRTLINETGIACAGKNTIWAAVGQVIKKIVEV